MGRELDNDFELVPQGEQVGEQVGEPRLPRKTSSFFSEMDDNDIEQDDEILKKWAVRIAERCESDSETVSGVAVQSDSDSDTGSVTSEASETTSSSRPRHSCTHLQGSLSVTCTGNGLNRVALKHACEVALVDTLSKAKTNRFSVALSLPPGPGGTFFGRAVGLLNFGFTVSPSDPNDINVLYEVLIQEAACAASLQLLPGLVSHLSSLDELNASRMQVGLDVQMR